MADIFAAKVCCERQQVHLQGQRRAHPTGLFEDVPRLHAWAKETRNILFCADSLAHGEETVPQKSTSLCNRISAKSHKNKQAKSTC